MKEILFINIMLFFNTIISSQNENNNDSILISHNCKIIEHGYFSFITFIDNESINKKTFSYSINLKANTFTLSLIDDKIINRNIIKKNDLYNFYTSDVWNKKRNKKSVEKYFLTFHQDFLKWDNSHKLEFFLEHSKFKVKQSE
jgi:hypothetical protein